MIVGQIGGGLGTQRHDYAPARITPGRASHGRPPIRTHIYSARPAGNRVQSFGTEVAAGATTPLTWSSLRPGTYLLESGTHPSIQATHGTVRNAGGDHRAGLGEHRRHSLSGDGFESRQ